MNIRNIFQAYSILIAQTTTTNLYEIQQLEHAPSTLHFGRKKGTQNDGGMVLNDGLELHNTNAVDFLLMLQSQEHDAAQSTGRKEGRGCHAKRVHNQKKPPQAARALCPCP